MPNRTRALCVTALFAALLAVGAWVAVPVTPPFTMQTFVLYCAVCVLPPSQACGAVALYWFLGAVGLPVFAGFQGGLGVLFGPTGGYILGFIWPALLALAFRRVYERHSVVLVGVLIVGTLLSYMSGVLWYAAASSMLTPSGMAAAFLYSVLPFVLPDAVKLVTALWLGRRLRSRLFR